MHYRWFPVVGYASLAIRPGTVRTSYLDGFMWATDRANAYVQMLERVKERFPGEDGYGFYDVIVLDYPQFTITKEGE